MRHPLISNYNHLKRAGEPRLRTAVLATSNLSTQRPCACTKSKRLVGGSDRTSSPQMHGERGLLLFMQQSVPCETQRSLFSWPARSAASESVDAKSSATCVLL